MPQTVRQFFDLQLKNYTPEGAKRIHIAIAKETISRFISRQQDKPSYVIETDGHRASSEDSVRPYGVIVYLIQRLSQAGSYAIKTAREMSPVESGRYRKSWFLLVDGVEVSENNIPENARELILTNDQPYSRKIERRGARLQGVPPGIVERVRQAVLRQYKNSVDIDIRYITLATGYKLKKPLRRRGRAEHELTYPALAIRPK